jgi:hypothetical protein
MAKNRDCLSSHRNIGFASAGDDPFHRLFLSNFLCE